jgi:hypothetical protein
MGRKFLCVMLAVACSLMLASGVNAGVKQYWWIDNDYDGYGDKNDVNPLYRVSQPSGYASNNTDCNDDPLLGGGNIHPLAAEGYGDPDMNCDYVPGPYFPDLSLETCVSDHTGGSLDPGLIATLSILDCPIGSISDLTGIKYLTSLDQLYLSGNTITDLSPLADLAGLGSLELDSNQIVNLSPLSGLTNLHYLNLANNNISSIEGLGSQIILDELDLSNNHISDITNLETLTAMNGLHLSNNDIADITAITYMPVLVWLELPANSISVLPSGADLSRNYDYLNRVDLSYNSISDISPLSEIGPGFLNLSHNSISELPANWGSPYAWTATLDLSTNSLTNIDSLSGFLRLVHVYLGGNCITNFDPVDSLDPKPNVYGKDQQCM